MTYFHRHGQSLTPQCEHRSAAIEPGNINNAHYCNFWVDLVNGMYFQFSVAASDVIPLALSNLKFLSTDDHEIFLRNGKSLLRRGVTS